MHNCIGVLYINYLELYTLCIMYIYIYIYIYDIINNNQEWFIDILAMTSTETIVTDTMNMISIGRVYCTNTSTSITALILATVANVNIINGETGSNISLTMLL